MFKVSVIIPVYNAAGFIRNAVESAMHLDEVGEIILVEDKSPDNALEICLQLQKEYEKIKLYRHPNGENRGAGASRNLGIEHAQCEYVAFLDADDWYLGNRFAETKSIFESDYTIDGVYESTGFYDNSTKRELPARQTTLKMEVNPQDLLYTLLLPNTGRFTTNAITVKKQLLLDVGLFDTTLRLHQDTHLWLKLAYSGKLVAGNIHSPVAMRRLHEQNRIAHQNLYTRKLFYEQTYEWFAYKPNVDKRAYKLLLKRFMYAKFDNNLLGRYMFFLKFIIKRPNLIFKII